MKMKGLFLAIVAMVCAMQLQAQDTPTLILIEGQVLSNRDSVPVPGVHIWGLKRNVGTTTDTSGWFRILAYDDDSLRFSAVGYGMQKQAIPASAAHQQVTFWLEEKDYNIKEVTVLPFTRAEFPRIFMETELPPDKYAINLNLPELPPVPITHTNFKNPASIALSILTLTVKLNIYEMLPEKIAFKERWEQKQIDQWLDREAYLNRIAEKYSPTFVKQIVPVSDEEVGPFLQFCNLQNEFVVAATEYEIGEAIKECYLAWVEKSE